MRSLSVSFAGTLLVTGALAQMSSRLDTVAAQLLDERRAAAALHDLRVAGAPGARALFAAYAGSDDADRLRFAEALAELGTTTRVLVEPLVAEIPRRDEPLRSLLLRALANGALLADDADRARINPALRAWARQGLVYSPSQDRPTYAWYEYVRTVRRLQLSVLPRDSHGLDTAMSLLRKERGSPIVLFLGNQQKPQPNDEFGHCAIESYGAHGQRELLEAIAELTLRCEAPSKQLVAELAAYLRHSPPRPPRVQVEHCAGIGEPAPNQLPGVKFPTRWRYDHWHFPLARAVLAHSEVAAERALALRHLLHADVDATRLHAIEQLRLWPQPWQPFFADLATGLTSSSRSIRRATLVTLGMADALPDDVREQLQALAKFGDAELRALAGRALR
jgi:hypothetical protein